MDIDELVESLSATSRQKIIKQQQNVQRLEWKQTAYRSVTKALKEFQSKYLDVLSPTNFRSTSMFNTIKAVSSSDAVTVSSTAKSAAGTITINSITRLATAQKIEMADGATASKPLTASKNLSAVIEELKAGSISMTLDGKVKTITFDSNFIDGLDSTNFETRLQSLIDNAFGASSGITVNASNADGPISFQVAAGSKLVLNSVGESTALTEMGFQSGQSNTLNTNAALGDLTLKTGLTEATRSLRSTMLRSVSAIRILWPPSCRKSIPAMRELRFPIRPSWIGSP
jgi:flagellar hook-associated protein 2